MLPHRDHLSQPHSRLTIPATMDLHRIDQQLRAKGLQSAGKLHWFESLGSTNDYLLYELQDYHAAVCLAAEQTAGRGRRGRPWQSAPGQGIYLSMGWDLRSASPHGLSLVCGLSVLQALRAQGIRTVALKWPNDILLQHKKLAGVLVELNRGRCVIGVGLNVTLPVSLDLTQKPVMPWTGLAEQGYEPNCELLTAALITHLNRDLTRFGEEGFAPYVEPWNACHAFQDAEVEMVTSHRIRGRVKGVNAQGALCLETREGMQVFHAGEVSLIPPEQNWHGH